MSGDQQDSDSETEADAEVFRAESEPLLEGQGVALADGSDAEGESNNE